MDCWFTTSHGDTCHNQPGTPNFVEGEPPTFPKITINYREKCLEEGFARIGYPNTGDLLNGFRGRLAPNGYSFDTLETISTSPLTRHQLKAFASIKAGDFIVIRADEEEHDVHFGVVLTKDHKAVSSSLSQRPLAYYFFPDIPRNAYYECAHRVNVKWAVDKYGEFGIYQVKEIGGLWRQAFGHLDKSYDHLVKIARDSGLLS